MGHTLGTTESQHGVEGTTNGPHKSGVRGYWHARGSTAADRNSAAFHEPTDVPSGVSGYHVGTEAGVGAGVRGESTTGVGVEAAAHDPSRFAVHGYHYYRGREEVIPPGGSGVYGHSNAPAAAGVFGENQGRKGIGVQGSGADTGVGGFSERGNGLKGFSRTGYGALAQSNSNSGLVATSTTGQAISAFSDNDVGLYSKGATFGGVFDGAVVVNRGPNPTPESGIKPSDINGCLVLTEGNLFLNDGSVFVKKGDVILENADCAEDFDVDSASLAEPGSVMVLGANSTVVECQGAYDKRVVGVVAGAGKYKPGLVLDRQSDGEQNRIPLSLLGKVFCKVDGSFGGVSAGDLLTTSPTRGHAMKAADPRRAFGAVIGKALAPLERGRLGLIPILIALQ